MEKLRFFTLTPRQLAFLLGLKSLVIVLCLGGALWVANPISVSACNYGNNGEVNGGCGTTDGGTQSTEPAAPVCTNPLGCTCSANQGPASDGVGSGGSAGDGGDAGPPAKVADPVDLFSGRQEFSIADLRLMGALPITVVRNYDSGSRYDSALGYGWAFNLDKRLYKYADNTVVVRESCGLRTRYLFVAGAYQPENKILQVSLIENPDGSFVRTYYNNYKEFYDAQGKLTAEQDNQNNRLEYTYDARGKLPLTGSSPYSVNPNVPTIVAYDYRLLKVEERLASGALSGQSVTLTYNDTSGRLQKIVASDEREVVYTQDTTQTAKNGNLINVKDVTNVNYAYQYNDAGDAHNLTSTQYGTELPYVNEYYPIVDKVKKQTHGYDVFEFTYINPLKASVTHKIYNAQTAALISSEVTTYSFTASGLVTIAETVLDTGTAYKMEYTRNATTGLAEQERSYEKLTGAPAYTLISSVDYTQDARGHKTSETITLASGEVITKTWGYTEDSMTFAQVVSSLAPTKIFRTEYTYFTDGNGKPTKRKEMKQRRDDGSFQITQYTYDAFGNVKTMTSPTGLVTQYDYVNNRLTQQQYLVSGSPIPQLKRVLGYDAFGNLNKITDAKNQITDLVNDSKGRALQVINALSETGVFTYIGNQLTQVEQGKTTASGEGQIVQLEYNAQGWATNAKQKKDDGSLQTVYSVGYDSAGKKLTETTYRNGLGFTTTFVYDAIGRLTKQTDANNNITQYTYDSFGNLAKRIDAKSRETLYTYDILGRLIKTENKSVTPSAVTLMTYDAKDNLLTVTDPENKTTIYTYDALSRLTRITQPAGQQTNYVYNTAGQLSYKLDARGLRTQYVYYAWGPVYRIEYYPTETSTTLTKRIEYAYDNNGNLTSVIDNSIGAAASHTYTYDALNRLKTQTLSYIPGISVVTTNTYDRFGNRSGLSLADGATAASTFTYNKLNQLSAISLPGSQNFTPTYFTDAGLMQKLTYPNGASANYTFDNVHALSTLSIMNSSNAVLDTLTYVYDKNIVVDTINSTRDGGLHDYNYDGLDQLTTATRPAGYGVANESYLYDKVGNREVPTDLTIYQYDNNHRITQSPGLLQYTYDLAGNQLTRTDGVTMTYDTDNRLITYAKGATSASYAYDAFGRRIKKTVDGVITYFAWDDSQLIAEYSSTGVRQKRYAYLPNSLNPVQVQDANGTYNVHSDHLDTARFLTNSAQAIVWSAKQSAFGQTTVNQDVDGNGTAVIYNSRFPGQYFDAESGLHYNYFRDYDPSIGRYIESDPIGLEGGINTYGYVEGNPLIFTDVRGLFVDQVAVEAALAKAAVKAKTGASLTPAGAMVAGFTPTLMGDGTIPPGNDSCPNPNNDDKCSKIISDIYDAMNTTHSRMADLLNDRLDLYNKARSAPNPALPPNSGSWDGHISQASGWQNRLRNLIQKANKNKCPVPLGAWSAASRPLPSKPRGH